MIKRVSARNLQLNFGKLKKELPLIITHYGKPIAIILEYRENIDGTPDVTAEMVGSHKKLYKRLLNALKGKK